MDVRIFFWLDATKSFLYFGECIFSGYMDHNLTIVLILTVGLALACVLGYIAQRLNLPSILGYLVAGFAIGPHSPGFVADGAIAEQLAEIGVILMLFGVGLHFKLQDLLNVRRVAIPGAAFQTLVATLAVVLIVYLAGWTIESGIIVGLSVGVASTVVLVRMLHDHQLLNTKEGHIAVGWLIVEDVFTVIVLMLLPVLASFSQGASFSIGTTAWALLFTLGKFAVLVFLMFTWGHKAVDFVLTNVARLRSKELFTLAVLSLVFVIATSSTVVFGTSIALGAFIAGMVIGKTSLRHQAAANALPLKDIFAIIFFLSVGMLFTPMAIVTHFALFAQILAVILLLKPLAAYLIVICFRCPLKVALTAAIALAQIGEFSFILAEEAVKLKLLPEDGFDILVACALVSISINPFLFKILPKIEGLVKKLHLVPKRACGKLNSKIENGKVKPNVLIIGFGPIGQHVASLAEKSGFDPFIIEHNIDTVAGLQDKYEILFGDAAEADILKEAHLKEASYLIITIPDIEKTVQIVQAARQINPHLEIIAKVEYISEKLTMDGLRVHSISTENEALKAFNELVLQILKKYPENRLFA